MIMAGAVNPRPFERDNMGRPKKIVEQISEAPELNPVVEPVDVTIEAEVVSVGSDGKVSVMKNGVTRRIYPGQLDAWRGEGWV